MTQITATRGPVARRRGRARVQPHTRSVVAPLLLGLVIIGLWTLLAAQSPPKLLPSPAAVAQKLWVEVTTGLVWPYLWNTLTEAVAGGALGALVALPLAVLIHRSRWLDDATRPFLGATQAIPAIALAPLLALWVGYGLVAIALLCALIVFFPILVTAVTGLRNIDKDVVDASRIDGASGFQQLFYVELPLALPWIYAGLRNGFTLSVTGAVVGEMVMGGAGLGTLLVVQRDQFDTAGMIATIVVLASVAAASYLTLSALERRSAVVRSLSNLPT